METIFAGTFYNPTKGVMSFTKAIDEMVSYMREDPEKAYEVIVGCDSSATAEPTFPLVMVVLRRGEGGRFFLQRVRYPEGRKFYNLHDRILQEVLLSCELALELRSVLQKPAEGLKYEFE
ncbi:MAG: ribonuclease H-like YkuK family protein [Candidatus Pacearchaeota archaeon]|nr:ribonuclease H-like YkuK family protein [Candidatus Pacearchaeota archaeon]